MTRKIMSPSKTVFIRHAETPAPDGAPGVAPGVSLLSATDRGGGKARRRLGRMTEQLRRRRRYN
jgi:hypothetical protein